jgi:hypothetical protein
VAAMIELNHTERCGMFYGRGDIVKFLKDKDVLDSEKKKYPSFEINDVIASIETQEGGHVDEMFIFQLEPGDFGFEQGMMFLIGSKSKARLS